MTRIPELAARIAAVSKDMAQPREAMADRLEYVDGAIAVLDIGGMDEDKDQKPAS